jgi:hypothetical protein
VALLTFEQALGKIPDGGRRHLLLGNGFSRAWDNNIFDYRALLKQDDFTEISKEARHAFNALETSDFERVMRTLRDTATIVKIYGDGNPDLVAQLREDANGLKNVLVQAIAGNHPDHPDAVTENQYKACRQFLGHFETMYTVNYDLLLYWTLMRKEHPPDIRCDDGFRQPDDGPQDYVTWEPDNIKQQNVHYLHGALHIFDSPTEVQK